MKHTECKDCELSNGDCDRYVRKDYSFLKSVIKTSPELYKEDGAE